MEHAPYVVAIAGGTCSGKSTLCDRLENTFAPLCPTLALHMDAYYKKETPTTVAPITRKVYAEHNTPEALELERFYSDFAQACVPGSGRRLVLVEGLFALYLEAVRERADLKVFVDLESDERLARRIVKFMAWGDTYEQVTSRYLDSVRFRHNELVEPTRWHADLVLNGTLDSHRGVAVLEGYLRQQLGCLS